MSSFADLELKVIQWAEARMIIPNSNPRAQACKTQEELNELIEALDSQSREGMRDAYGDILVTLIIGADLAGFSMCECLEYAYLQIKDRKGYLNENGIFVKDE